MVTKNGFIQHWKLSNGAKTKAGTNDESITAKVRKSLEEWDQQDWDGHLNSFRSLGKNDSTKKLIRQPVK